MEDRIQADIVKYLRKERNTFVYSTPNEGAGRDAKMRTAQLITMGLFPGVADLTVWWHKDNRIVIGYLEVKTKTGRQSSRQVHFQEMCEDNGIPYHVVRSVWDVAAYMDSMGFCSGEDR